MLLIVEVVLFHTHTRTRMVSYSKERHQALWSSSSPRRRKTRISVGDDDATLLKISSTRAYWVLVVFVAFVVFRVRRKMEKSSETTTTTKKRVNVVHRTFD